MFFGIRWLMPSKHFALFVTIAISFVLVVSANYSPQILIHHNLPPSLSLIGEEKIKNGEVITWGRRRSFELNSLNFSSTQGKGNKTEEVFLLAKERTHRRDPLNQYQYYDGGWNATDKHYWGSAAFTAAPFLVSSIVWFVFCGIGLFVTCICYCCRRKKTYGYSKTAYCLSLFTLITFTVMAIAGCVVLYTGQGLFYKSSKRTMDYLVLTASDTAQNIRNVSDYLSAAKKVGVDAIVLPQDVQKYIDGGMGTIRKAADVVSETTEKTARASNEVLFDLKLALMILSAVMILLVFLGFVLSMFGKRLMVYSLVIIGWILVTGTFILCGAFLIIHNVFGDACVSMHEWVQKQPQAHTALDDFLPCVDKDLAQGILNHTKVATYYSVVVVNKIITEAANLDPPEEGHPFNYNQSGPLLRYVCNPFNENTSDRQCEPDEVEMAKAHQEWQQSVCEVDENGQCVTEGRLTPSYFEQMSAFVNVSYALYRYGPFLAELADCTFVNKTFSDITKDHCPGLRLHSKWIYIGLLTIALAVALSMMFWVIYCRERRNRLYTKTCDSMRSTELANQYFGNQQSLNLGSAAYDRRSTVSTNSRDFATASVGSTNFGSATHGSRHSDRENNHG